MEDMIKHTFMLKNINYKIYFLNHFLLVTQVGVLQNMLC
jgi:hypothetical protein